MGWQYTPYLIVLGASGLLASAVAPVAWHHRDREGAVPLAVLMAAVTWWTLANAVGVAHTDLSGKRLAYRVMYLGVAVVPVAWIGFTVEYTGARVGRRDRLLGVAGIVPALTVPIALTNVRHGLLWREVWLVKDGPLVAMGVAYGPWFWVFTLVAYLLLAAGTLLLVRLVVLGEHVYRRQAAALLVAVLAPWAANAVYLADLTPPGIDPTPVGFA
ncbi:MAG: histidine kinase N-terminal 7TM domain-containing protein, partial [Halobacteriales archaeon]